MPVAGDPPSELRRCTSPLAAAPLFGLAAGGDVRGSKGVAGGRVGRGTKGKAPTRGTCVIHGPGAPPPPLLRSPRNPPPYPCACAACAAGPRRGGRWWCCVGLGCEKENCSSLVSTRA